MPKTALSSSAEVAAGFHALSDATRVEIVELLRSGERCQCELTDDLDAAQSRLSFHIKVLKDAGLLTDRREGRWVYYTLNTAALKELEEYLSYARTPGLRAGSGKGCCD